MERFIISEGGNEDVEGGREGKMCVYGFGSSEFRLEGVSGLCLFLGR